jgi:hypothetical protein
VHGGEEGHGAQPELAKRVLDPHIGVGGHRIEHKESDEARGVFRDGNTNRRLIAGNAGDEGAPGYAMTIEFGDPSVREHFWSARRFPAEPRRDCDSSVVHRQALDIFRDEFKKARGEEMTVAVAERHGGILVQEVQEVQKSLNLLNLALRSFPSLPRKLVAHAMDGEDELRMPGVGLDFLPQPGDVDVNRAC